MSDIRRTWLGACCLGAAGLALAAGCGDATPGSAADEAAEVPAIEAAVEANGARDPRLLDPRIGEARAAIEAGLPDAAWVLLEQLAGAAESEILVLRARAALAGGDGIGALREVEDALALHPEDPEVAGTEIEVLAALDRLPSAEDALRDALKRFGRVAVLERARGVLLLRAGGKGREALAALEAARALDPDLAFVAFPLAQARGLAGRAALGEGKAEEALALARAALADEPADPDLRELEAESLAALFDFEGALAIQDELAAEGRGEASTRAGLHQKLATRLLLEHRRAEAIEEYVAARELGLDDEGLGFGATVLAEEGQASIERGIAAFERGELAAAEAEFRAALRLVPSDLEAQNHLGLVRFRLEDYAAAAELWQAVLDGAEARSVALPAPVHLNLARALRLAGDVPRARALLETYLEGAPEGEFAAETRELLARLDLEAPAPGR